MSTEWTEETIRPHLFTQVEVRDDNGTEWVRNKLDGYRNEGTYRFYARGELWQQMRLIPKKQYIPWTVETFPDCPITKLGYVFKATRWSKDGAYLTYIDASNACTLHLETWGEILKDFKTQDGSPCGEEVTK